MSKIRFFLTLLIILTFAKNASAACGATDRIWDGSNNSNWSLNNNWGGNNQPDNATENAIVVSGKRILRSDTSVTISCLIVQSGTLQSRNGNTITIVGDYFTAPTANMINAVVNHSNWEITLAGTAAQTVSIVDPLNVLTISNNTTVTFTDSFSIRNALNLVGSTTQLLIQNNLLLESTASTLTIPAGVTVEVSAGAIFYSNVNIVVNGVLRIKDGATLSMGNGKIITVNSGALFQVQGSAGNIATVTANGSGSTYALNIAGLLNASYFRFDRLNATGINLTGTLQAMNSGEFHYLSTAGAAITLGAAASIPATMTSVGFYNDLSYPNVKNFKATLYNGSATTINNWSGSAGGAANETDPNSKINWGTQAGVEMTVSNNTPSNLPPATLAANSAATHFATFAFGLTQASTLTNITQVKLTMTGSALTSDLAYVRVYKDAGGGTNCIYDAGVDTQVGSNLTFSGSPLSSVINFSTGDIQTSSDTARGCFHVVAATSATAQDGNTIQFGISATGDVVNSFGYNFSISAGPPVSAGLTSITGGTTRTWQGDRNTLWSETRNWTGNTLPTSTTDCDVGAGVRIPSLNIASAVCRNATLLSGGTLDFGSTANELAAHGSLILQSGYTLTNASAGVLALRGSSNQSLLLGTAFPGNVNIVNTGTAPNNVVNLNGNSEVIGNLTIISGRLRVGTGLSLTVRGNIDIQSGGVLDIEPGGTLYMSNTRVLTVASGGTLEIVGSSGSNAILSGLTASDAFRVVVNGTISGRYYSMSRLGTPGLSVESGASIDASNYLQDGTFTYPVASSSTLIALKRQIPGNNLTNMSFSLNGSQATSITNVNTTGAAAGTLNISNYSGDISGPAFDIDPSYAINWSGATNTLNLDRPSGGEGPTSVNAGGTYNMGRFRFKQTQAGASYVDADLLSLKIQIQGTASGSDISVARIYYDSDCDGLSGVLLASGSFSGNPAERVFSISGGSAPIEASATAPPERCVYLEADLSSSATGGATLGFQISQSSHVSNSESYQISGATVFPVTLGAPGTIVASASTTWTGTTNTTWATGTNWTGGVPSATKDCIINDVTNDPVIASGTAICKNLTIGNGILNLQAAGTLQVYGNFSNTGTFTQAGTLQIRDSGAGGNHSISSSTALTSLTFNKTTGGQVSIGSSTLQINTLTIPGGSNFELFVGGGKTLILPSGVSWTSGTFTLANQSTLKIGASSTLSIVGGTFRTQGVNDFWPQNLTNKATITRNGAAGTWGFSASAGTVSLTGFVIEWINETGLLFSGSASLTSFSGGQFRNLSNNYAAVKALQLNITSIPAAAANIGWNWGPNNTAPATTEAYKLVTSTGCGANTISFDYWFGDWSVNETTPDPDTKTSGTNCTITMGASASPVTLHAFTAAGYDGSAIVQWKTSAEWNHRGFNLYRSAAGGDYVKLNTDLIQQGNTSPEVGELYLWADDGLTNGIQVGYLLEAVSLTGAVDRYGPIYVTPLLANGVRPELSTLIPIGGGSGSPGSSNPFLRDLGGGIKLTSITDTRVVLEITSPVPSLSTSAWNGSYSKLEATGYVSTLTPGYPELLSRSVLIEVESWVGTAILDSITNSSSTTLNGKIQPAPQWVKDSNDNLTASYAPDAAAYASSSYAPLQNLIVEAAPIIVDGRKYIKVDFTPSRYLGSGDTTEWLTAARVSIALTKDSSAPAPAIGNSNISPSVVPYVLRAKFANHGLATIRYQDLVDAGIDSYFAGADISALRAYIGNKQVPIQIESADSVFSSGDQIIFYIAPFDQKQDCCQEIVLAKDDLFGEGASLRTPAADATPVSSVVASSNWTFARAHAEQDLFMVWDSPVGVDHDHMFWQRAFYPVPPWVPGGSSYSNISVDLPGLRNISSENVTVRVKLASGAVFAQNVESEFGIWVNSVSFRLGQVSSNKVGVQEVSFTVPAHYFTPGENLIHVEAIGGLMPSGDYQVTSIDSVDVDYRADLYTESDKIEMLSRAEGKSYYASGFSSSDLILWDVSEPLNPVEYQNASIVLDDSKNAIYFTVPDSTDNSLGYRVLAIERGQLNLAQELFVNRGYYKLIRDTSNKANLIIIANNNLMASARVYAESRKKSGLSVALYSTDQVFAEFGSGRESSQAIRDMIKYAKGSWQAPKPSNILFIGKASVDPKNIFGYNSSSTNVMPIAVDQGTYADYGSDHWFVAQDGNENLPDMAVGRIPATTNEDVLRYLRKVESYESGLSAPQVVGQTSHYIFTDGDSSNENFPEQGDKLKTELSLLRKDLAQEHFHRATVANDAVFASKIDQAFSAGPVFVSLLGHGATDFWADSSLLSKTEVANMSNSRYPIVLGMGCMLGYHYDPDQTKISLGESLILQPNAGAILFWGTPAVTIPGAQVALNEAFFKEFSQVQVKDNARMGSIMTKAKLSVGVNAATKDTVRSWTLLGDPTVRLPASAAKENSKQEDSGSGGGCGMVNGTPPTAPPGQKIIYIMLLFIPLLLLASARRKVRVVC